MGVEVALPRPIPEGLLEPLAGRLRVLGEPLRIRLVELLDREGELSVGELAGELQVSSHNASQQLAVLRRAGVVSRRQRGREGIYRLVDGRAVAVYELVWASLEEERRRRSRELGGS
jgi:DNA-binding transcriptional ArsR family regulator